MSKIEVTQKRSTIGQCPKNRKIIKALGLGKINRKKVFEDNNCIRGMVNKVQHLVEYKLLDK